MTKYEKTGEDNLTLLRENNSDMNDSLFDRVSTLIEQTRQSVATYTNLALTLTFWRVGHMIDDEILGQQRADYGEQIVASLGPQLVALYGKGYEKRNLYRMVRFARIFPEEQIVASLEANLLSGVVHWKNETYCTGPGGPCGGGGSLLGDAVCAECSGGRWGSDHQVRGGR